MSAFTKKQNRLPRIIALGVFLAMAFLRPAMADGRYMTKVKAQLMSNTVRNSLIPIEFLASKTVMWLSLC